MLLLINLNTLYILYTYIYIPIYNYKKSYILGELLIVIEMIKH